MIRFFFFFILLLSGLSSAISQKPGMVFHQLTLTDGLSESTIRGIAEDNRGFMWFGTEDGVNRYDGYEFKIYRSDASNIHSLSSNNCKYLYTDRKGNLWVLTRDGVNIYDQKKDCFYSNKSKKYAALSNLAIDAESITEDYKGNYWIAGNEEGIIKIESLNSPSEKYNSLLRNNGNIIISIHPLKDGSLLLGSKDGLIKFNPSNNSFTDLRQKYGKGYQINRFFEDEEGSIWLATSSGLKVIKKDDTFKEYYNQPENEYSLGGNNLTDIIKYKDGNLLVAIDGGGIDYFDLKSGKFYHYKDENESQLSANNITSMFLDSKGDLWAGTFLNGINFSNSTTNLFVLIRNNPNSQKSIKKGIISRFLKDRNNNLWIATDGNGLYKKKAGSKGEFIHYTPQNTPNIGKVFLSIREDANGLIWFATYDAGLCVYDPKKDKFKNYVHNPSDPSSISTNQIKDICSFDGNIWCLGFGTGISVLDPQTERFIHFRYDKFYTHSVPSDWIQCIQVDKNGQLWLGTFKGLSKYDPVTRHFINYKHADPYTNYILDIYEDSQGTLWLGTSGGGLAWFDSKEKEIKTYTTTQGLSDNNVKSILEDDYGFLWLSTNNGISRMNLKNRFIKAYTIKDGVPPVSYFGISKYKDEEGKIYFGSNKGYLVIDPKMTTENRRPPAIVMTELKISNEIIKPGKSSPLDADITETREIHLSYDQNSITFKFAALNFNNSRNNQYSYLLEGFDKEWVFSGTQRTATYTNLNPGKYFFKVKASNNDAIWNEEGITLEVIITPPYWKTWWFNGGIILGFIGILYTTYYYRTRSIRKKNLKLERTVRKRTKELKDANEQLEAFVYKASHDIKGPLKSIIGLTTIGQKDIKDEGARQYFEHILKSTRKLDNLLMDLLEITKVKQATIQKEKIDFNALVDEVITSFQKFPGFDDIQITVAVNSKADFYSDKKLLYSLIQNLVENPIKYQDPTKKPSYLDISITTDEKGAYLTFEDNGLGIPAEYHKKVFDMFFKVNDSSNGTGLGLYIVKTTVEKLNGTISLESAAGKGSTFKIHLRT